MYIAVAGMSILLCKRHIHPNFYELITADNTVVTTTTTTNKVAITSAGTKRCARSLAFMEERKDAILIN